MFIRVRSSPSTMIKAQLRADPDRVLQHLLVTNREDEGQSPGYCFTATDWAALSGSAERHGVLGILHSVLTSTPGGVPPAIEAELRRRAALQRLLQSQVLQALTEILDALGAAGVETVALKGPVLGERLHGDPSLRVSADLDLMVAWSQLAAAQRVLARLGYRVEAAPSPQDRWGHHITATREDAPPVELHYRLTSYFGTTISAEEFLSRAMPYRTAGGACCRILAPEDEVLFLVLHAAHHLFVRLAWLFDVKAFLRARPDLDWQVVADRAERLGVARAFAFALTLIARRMEINLPEGAIRAEFSRPRRGVLNLVLSAAGRSSGARAKALGFVFRSLLCDRPALGARYLGYHIHRVARR
jgi:hypothetical protein